MKLKDLLEKRARIVTDMRAIADAPAGQAGDLSEDQATNFDALKRNLEAIEGSIARQTALDEAERRMQGQQITGGGDRQFDREVRNFSLVRAIAAASGLGVDDGREREISAELARRSGRQFQGIAVPMDVFQLPVEQRVITTAAPGGGPGSNLISLDHLGGQYIDVLRAKLVIRQLGARVLTGLVGNVDIPRLKASATAGWFAENAAITASDAQHERVLLSPKHVGALTEFSRNMLLQSSPDIEQLVRADFAGILAEAMDKVAIRGGSTNEPTGVLATAGVDTTTNMTTGGGGPTWGKVLSLIGLVETANANVDGAGWVTTPLVVQKLRSTLVAADTDSRMIQTSPKELADYPLASTSLAVGPAAVQPLIFGDWSEVLIGMWSALDVLVNPYESTAYSKGNVQVRGIITADIALRHPKSFAAALDVSLT